VVSCTPREVDQGAGGVKGNGSDGRAKWVHKKGSQAGRRPDFAPIPKASRWWCQSA